MDRIFQKAKAKAHGAFRDHSFSQFPGTFDGSQEPICQDRASTIQAPTPLDVFRYRYHHGTNIGSVYVLEKWLHPSMFPTNASDKQSSELEAIRLSVQAIGLDATRQKFQKHWRTVSDADLDWLADARCTSIRLPIGYFTLGPSFCSKTPFAPYAIVYTDAWSSVKNLIFRARARGIGTLIDLHALPGGANCGEHSGTNSGKAELWNNAANLDLATRCLEFLAREITSMDCIVGLQLVNEADWDSPGMYNWYETAISAIGRIDASIPIYISDGWNLSKALNYIGKKNNCFSARPTNPVIVDTHFYWAFTNEDKAKSPQQITSEVWSKLCELDGKDGSVVDRGAFQVVVGEYSCVMTEDSWARGGCSRDTLIRDFGAAQSARYQSRSGGSFFWTYAMDWPPGGEWGFRAQTASGAITAPSNLLLSADDVRARLFNAQARRDAKMAEVVGAHCAYWDRTAPGGYFEHWRFENGWKVGWADAVAFFEARVVGRVAGGKGGDKIGCLDVWVRKRILESGMQGKFLWEYEQGLRQGVGSLYECAGI
ncbi:Glucan 1,3-beta-glucosidase 3 [Coniosporium apollinis]|uniref:Glucan 1,3-beta-glucosidase 3 n=1 Tax=Coniosporium apollinis TaxID=61459 RepID=A0ABQ9NPE5_9PEZI|nr:Glucan 1,3-beta-glucosidase 3 [Coniosporium apollinis]